MTLQMGEGVNSNDRPYRQLSGVFEGRNGKVLLTISAPDAHWDAAEVDAFLASIQ